MELIDHDATSQPNFTALFMQLAATKGPLRISVRQDGNFRHDIAFVSSLIHDAEACFKDFRLNRSKFTLKLNRTRWERRLSNLQKGIPELDCVGTRLMISNVESMTTRFSGPPPTSHDPNTKFCVMGFDASRRDERNFVTIDAELPRGGNMLIELVVGEYPDEFLLIDQK